MVDPEPAALLKIDGLRTASGSRLEMAARPSVKRASITRTTPEIIERLA